MDALLVPTFFCPKAWKDMAGGETSRFCSYCHKQVHNLEALSVSERLALLSAPAASICSRYKVAIRRPAKGREEDYRRHMLKYGARAVVTGSVMLVLWEMRTEAQEGTFYRAVTGMHQALTNPEWPSDLYEEHQTFAMGAIAVAPGASCTLPSEPDDSAEVAEHVDLKLDPAEVDKLVQPLDPPPGLKTAGTTSSN